MSVDDHGGKLGESSEAQPTEPTGVKVLTTVLDDLGLYAMSYSLRGCRVTYAEAVQHIRDTVRRGRRTAEWDARAIAVLDRLERDKSNRLGEGKS